MSLLKSVVVFCGGAEGRRAVYHEEAEKLGRILAKNQIKLVYGAGGTGLMRAVADGALNENGCVIGSTIRSLYDIERPDLIFDKIQKVEIFQTMSDRKVSMTKQADGICILPGGLGTMDELFEVVVLRQLGISRQPIVLVNINDFFEALFRMLLEMVGEGFMSPLQLKLFRIVKTVDDVLPALEEEMKKIEQEKKNA